MKKINFLLLISVIALNLNAQTSMHPWGIGLSASTKMYRGDLGNGFFKFNDVNINPGLRLGRYLNPSFDLGLNAGFGRYDFSEVDETIFNQALLRTKTFNADLNLRYKFNNGYILKENSLFGPYLTAGVGYFRLKGRKTPFTLMDNDQKLYEYLNIPVGIGTTINLSNRINLFIQGTYNYTNGDRYDRIESFRRGYDKHIETTVGVVYQFGKSLSNEDKDSDKDGVMDSKDKCPNTKKGIEVDENGCPKISEVVKQDISDIATKIYFNTNSDSIKSESFVHLDRLVTYLKQFKEVKVGVEGHTDNVGDATYNLNLSKRRAEAVKNYLISKGIDSKRIMSEGYGDTKPITGNDTEEGRAKNRRVELKFFY